MDGFVVGELLHTGGMATLRRVERPGISMPLLMKIPALLEGEDPAAIVGFEMEQMILPRLSGIHVPKFVASGDFSVQPYIVMEHIQGHDAPRRARGPPAPVRRGRRDRDQGRGRAARPPPPERRPPRHQALEHHHARDGRGRARGLRPRAPRPAPGPHGRGVPRPVRDGAVHGARADPRQPDGPAERHLRARRPPLLLLDGRPPVRGPERDAPPQEEALVGPGAAAAPRGGLPAVAPGGRPALSRGRSAAALPDGLAPRVRPRAPRAGEAHGALGEDGARPVERPRAPPVQSRRFAPPRSARSRPRSRRRRSSWSPWT